VRRERGACCPEHLRFRLEIQFFNARDPRGDLVERSVAMVDLVTPGVHGTQGMNLCGNDWKGMRLGRGQGGRDREQRAAFQLTRLRCEADTPACGFSPTSP
jgi:hypothetical protein